MLGIITLMIAKWLLVLSLYLLLVDLTEFNSEFSLVICLCLLLFTLLFSYKNLEK